MQSIDIGPQNGANYKKNNPVHSCPARQWIDNEPEVIVDFLRNVEIIPA